MVKNSPDSLRIFSGGVALITGGASGIGAALARTLVARGASVVLADRQLALSQAVARELGDSARAVELDVRNADAFEAVVSDVVRVEGRIDYFFNNAGIGIGGLFEEQSIDDWRYIIDVNLLGVVYGAHTVYRVMLEQGFGHIVNTASMAGLIPTPGLSTYAATKHAVVGLTRALRAEGARRGVRVRAFCPGLIGTAIIEDGGVFGKFTGDVRERPMDTEELQRRAMDVDAFAAAAIERVATNDEIIVLPWPWRIFRLFDRLFPALIGTFLARRFFREYERLIEARRAQR